MKLFNTKTLCLVALISASSMLAMENNSFDYETSLQAVRNLNATGKGFYRNAEYGNTYHLNPSPNSPTQPARNWVVGNAYTLNQLHNSPAQPARTWTPGNAYTLNTLPVANHTIVTTNGQVFKCVGFAPDNTPIYELQTK